MSPINLISFWLSVTLATLQSVSNLKYWVISWKTSCFLCNKIISKTAHISNKVALLLDIIWLLSIAIFSKSFQESNPSQVNLSMRRKHGKMAWQKIEQTPITKPLTTTDSIDWSALLFCSGCRSKRFLCQICNVLFSNPGVAQ